MFKISYLSSIIIITVIILSCTPENEKDEKKWNLVFRDGLLYSDSLTTEPFTGHYKGKVMGKSIEYEVVDGKRNGIFILYNENGFVETLGYLKENKNHGEWKYYYPNGELESVGIFNDDKPDSVWNWFYMDGTIMQKGSFNEGKKDGEWKSYDEFNNLTLLLKYNNDVLIDSVHFEMKSEDRMSGLDTLNLNND
jgi:antitoxin component YwqK of YwqJK toxin-antitoxin module